MLNNKNTKQIIINIVSSLLFLFLTWLLQMSLKLGFWQAVSLYLFVISIAISLYAVYYFKSMRSQDNTNENLMLFDTNKPDISDNIQKCKKAFRFLGVSSKRTMSNPVVQKKLIELGKDGGEIKILLLNPESEFVKSRADDEKESSKAWVSDIKATIERLKDLANRKDINIEVKLYDQYPVWRLSVVDDEEMYVNFFLKGQQGPQSQLLYVKNKDNDLFNALMLEYERIWDSSVDA